MPMYPHCGGSRPVSVVSYIRKRNGVPHKVCAHCRGLPTR